MKRLVGAVVAALVLSVVGVTAVAADQPGPGDQQCIPGQQGNPHPAHKAGVCTNP